MGQFPDRIQKHFDREEKASTDELRQAIGELKQIAIFVAAMRHVTIPDGQEPEGAVAVLYAAAKDARQALSPHWFYADTIEALDAALARFESTTPTRTRQRRSKHG